MRDDLPVWRSLMFVPVTAEKFVRTGADRGADAIILDLEDAVAPSQKAHARTLIEAAIPQVSRNGADVVVRVNRPWRLLVRDLEAAVIPGVAALDADQGRQPRTRPTPAPRSLRNWKPNAACRQAA